ncbi:hypothetical protein [Jiulongibacter sediminis]|jgi:hypothetical protein|uniref:hypothetical protein n=1 Tax=Jiulongibacter sediminis TaxID=1605367 RepID=UPI0026EE2E2C|nr:hypothetical protein [Jiulongibacter sediminis]
MGTTLKNLAIAVLLMSISFACSKSGTKALEQGDYYNAVLQAVDKLKKDVDNEKSLEVLPQAYAYASEELMADINNAKQANQQFRYERVLDGYSKLNNMHDLISRCVSCRREVSTRSYFKEAEEARELAAEERYTYANSMLEKSTIESGRDAFESFQILFDFAPNFKDVRDKMDEALDAGSYHVVVEQPKVNSRVYKISNEYFQDRIDEFLRENKRLNKFIRFYSPAEAKTVELRPDHVIRLDFVDFVVGETLVERSEKAVTSEDSVKTGTATIRGKSVDVYDKVTATLSQNRKIVNSKGILSMEIIDFQTDRVLDKKEFPGEFTWVNEWASFNGDERALTEDELAMSKMKEELPPPPQQLFVEFCKPIYDQFTREVRRFYDRY